MNGSLTTPSCSEGVKWYIAQKHIHTSIEQIEEKAELPHHNDYRSIQPLNGCVVKDVADD